MVSDQCVGAIDVAKTGVAQLLLLPVIDQQSCLIDLSAKKTKHLQGSFLQVAQQLDACQ